MNIEFVISFLDVVQHGSFQNAASSSYITQPALTARIKMLEKDLGCTLFTRNKKGAVLTREGKIFYPYACDMITSYKQAYFELNNGMKALDIGTIMSASVTILPRIIDFIKKENPYISLKVHAGYSVHLLESVLKRECGFAITQEILHPDIVSLPFYKDPISLYVPISHKFAGRTVALEEISKEALICCHPDSGYWKEIHDFFDVRNFRLNIAFNIDSIEACRTMVSSGMGIAFLPELSLEAVSDNRSICKVPIEPPMNIFRTLMIIFRKERTQPPYIELLLRILDEMNLKL